MSAESDAATSGSSSHALTQQPQETFDTATLADRSASIHLPSSHPASMPSFKLTGHTQSVLCLHAPQDNSTQPHMLLSGSEDGTCRVWDMRVRKAVRCIKTDRPDDGDAAVTSVALHPTNEHHVYLAIGNHIQLIDLRATNDIIIRKATREWVMGDEEINQLSIHGQGRYIAGCDDNGTIVIIDSILTNTTPFKRISAHTNLCSSVSFRPKATWEVWSGGMDCEVAAWDFSRGRRTHTFTTQPTNTNPSSAQTLNPPFINALSFIQDGEHVLVASGNGEILLYDARRKRECGRYLGHTHSVMHVSGMQLPASFPSRHAFTDGRCVVSGGNDQNIILWDINFNREKREKQAQEQEQAERQMQQGGNISSSTLKNRKKKEKKKAKKAAANNANASSESKSGEDETEAEDTVSSSVAALSLSISQSDPSSSSTATPSSIPNALRLSSSFLPVCPSFSSLESSALDVASIRYRWRHSFKMNAIATATQVADTHETYVYVADISNDITVYSLR